MFSMVIVTKPFLATMRQVQTQYKKLFDEVESDRKPLFLLKGSEPRFVVLDIKTYTLLSGENIPISDPEGYKKNTRKWAGFAKGKYGDPVKFQRKLRKDDYPIDY
jgi:hypothetical protein